MRPIFRWLWEHNLEILVVVLAILVISVGANLFRYVFMEPPIFYDCCEMGMYP